MVRDAPFDTHSSPPLTDTRRAPPPFQCRPQRQRNITSSARSMISSLRKCKLLPILRRILVRASHPNDVSKTSWESLREITYVEAKLT
jgi:hypothetical protein